MGCRVPVVSLRSTTGYRLASLRDASWGAPEDGRAPGVRGAPARPPLPASRSPLPAPHFPRHPWIHPSASDPSHDHTVLPSGRGHVGQDRDGLATLSVRVPPQASAMPGQKESHGGTANTGRERTPQVGAIRRGWHPSGVREVLWGAGFRWCRFAQPPATGWHPSGMHLGVRPRTGALPASVVPPLAPRFLLPAPHFPLPTSRVIRGSTQARVTLLTITRFFRAAGGTSDKTGTVLLPSP